MASRRVGRVVLRGQLVTDSEVAAAVVRVLKGFEFPVTAVVPQRGTPLLRPNAGQPDAAPTTHGVAATLLPVRERMPPSSGKRHHVCDPR